MLIPHRTKLGRGRGGNPKEEKELNYGRGRGSILPNRAADTKAGRLEGLWHFGKTKKREAGAFKLWIRAKERKRVE